MDQVALGVLAIALGAVVGVALFVPFVALSFRRRGGLSFGRFALWAAALVYVMAIWTYTLLPLPDPAALHCAGTNLDPFAFLDDVRGAIDRPGRALTDPAVLQLLLNVLLFVPLGFFVRVLAGRGVVVAAVVGLGVSAFIETTQLTGVWTLYPCAYRVFDVDDMLTNTLGALLGALLSLVVPRQHRGSGRRADADQPRRVTKGRRALAMLCDALGFGLSSLIVSVIVRLWLGVVVGVAVPAGSGEIADIIGAVVSAAVWLAVILVSGGSVGDLAVQLRYVGGPLPVGLRRVLRWAAGVSGYSLLMLLPEPWALAGLLFGVVTVVMFFATQRGRGLPGLASGMRLRDARESTEAAPLVEKAP